MDRSIRAVILDGFHKGHVVSMPYRPTIRLLKPRVVMVDTCCDGGEFPEGPEEIEYRECFRGVDGKTILYSLKGDSTEILDFFPWTVSQYPWTWRTTLYFGYHDGFLRREDEPSLPKSST